MVAAVRAHPDNRSSSARSTLTKLPVVCRQAKVKDIQDQLQQQLELAAQAAEKKQACTSSPVDKRIAHCM